MEFIDLTQTITATMPGVSMKQSRYLETDGWNANDITLYSHSGTHIDAPVHFGMQGSYVDELTFDRLICEAWVCDVTSASDGALLKPEDLGTLRECFEPGDSLVLHTGWSKYATTSPERYRNKLPRVSESLATWLVNRKANILAVEPPSVADVNNLQEVSKIHQILFSGQVIIVEGICNVALLTSKKVALMVFPLKIKNGDGAPARVVAKNIV